MSVALELLDNLDLNEILKISGFLDDSTLEKLIKTLQSKNFEGARKILIAIENLDSRNFLRQIMERLGSLNIESSNYNKIISFIGEIDYRISQGADAKIQILALIGELIRNIKIDT